MERKYEFSWELLGDLDLGRPNLGRRTDVHVYRLMQFCLRDAIEAELGADGADRVFWAAGRLAGMHLYDHALAGVSSFDAFASRLQQVLRELEIGILRVEEVSAGADRLTMTIAEDLDCSGLPELSYEVCTFDEGMIAGLLERFTGRPYTVKEVDCWCTGDRTCRFEARVAEA